MKFGLIINQELENFVEKTAPIIEFLKAKNHEIYIADDVAPKFGLPGVPVEQMKTDILLAVGGDGTILRALRKSNTKIFGINAGVLGFLTEVRLEDAVAGLSRILRGDYIVESRIKLKVVLNGKRLADCTNEAVLHTAQISKLRHFEIFIDGYSAMDIRSDGIIVATATGSTSYALSTGGPLIDPKLQAFVISPIAPFKLSTRPIVVAAESIITIRLLPPKRQCLLVLDGQEEFEIAGEDVVEFTRSEYLAEFIRFGSSFYRRVEEKLKG